MLKKIMHRRSIARAGAQVRAAVLVAPGPLSTDPLTRDSAEDPDGLLGAVLRAAGSPGPRAALRRRPDPRDHPRGLPDRPDPPGRLRAALRRQPAAHPPGRGSGQGDPAAVAGGRRRRPADAGRRARRRRAVVQRLRPRHARVPAGAGREVDHRGSRPRGRHRFPEPDRRARPRLDRRPRADHQRGPLAAALVAVPAYRATRASRPGRHPHPSRLRRCAGPGHHPGGRHPGAHRRRCVVPHAAGLPPGPPPTAARRPRRRPALRVGDPAAVPPDLAAAAHQHPRATSSAGGRYPRTPRSW